MKESQLKLKAVIYRVPSVVVLYDRGIEIDRAYGEEAGPLLRRAESVEYKEVEQRGDYF